MPAHRAYALIYATLLGCCRTDEQRVEVRIILGEADAVAERAQNRRALMGDIGVVVG